MFMHAVVSLLIAAPVLLPGPDWTHTGFLRLHDLSRVDDVYINIQAIEGWGPTDSSPTAPYPNCSWIVFRPGTTDNTHTGGIGPIVVRMTPSELAHRVSIAAVDLDGDGVITSRDVTTFQNAWFEALQTNNNTNNTNNIRKIQSKSPFGE